MKLEPIIKISPAWTAACGRLGVHFFEGQLTVQDMDQIEASADHWLRENPGRIVELVVVLPSNARMTTAERRRMTGLIKRWANHRDASGTVILADGLVGAMHRSVLTGMLMLAPPPHPSKVFGTLAEAVTWLYPYVRPLCREATSPGVVLGAVEALGAAFRARPLA